jgi:hypothetical protein
MAKPLDEQIDQLYQLPLDEFTAARNALAKDSGASEIKKLEKPNLAAWTVNQLYWRDRKAYDEVIKAAERMRAAYKQMLAGKTADVRGAEEIHEEALREAKRAARKLLEEGGHPNPDAVMMPVAETLDALPGEERAGRLTKPLRRMGFNVLEGVPISAKAGPQKPKAGAVNPVYPPGRLRQGYGTQEGGHHRKAAPEKEQSARERKASEAEERELAMTRERLRFAEAAERDAEATLERAKRAVERTERTRERVEREYQEAVEAAKSARAEQAAGEKALAKATAERERLSKKSRG